MGWSLLGVWLRDVDISVLRLVRGMKMKCSLLDIRSSGNHMSFPQLLLPSTPGAAQLRHGQGCLRQAGSELARTRFNRPGPREQPRAVLPCEEEGDNRGEEEEKSAAVTTLRLDGLLAGARRP
jgi:hypothetical protein